MRSNQKYWQSSRRARRFREARGCGGCWSSSSPSVTTWTGARGAMPWASSWRVSPGSPTPSPAATRAWPCSTSWPAPARRRWGWCPTSQRKIIQNISFQFRECLFLEADLPHIKDAAKVKYVEKEYIFSQSKESQRRERKTPDLVSSLWLRLTAGLFDTNLSLICIVRIHLLQSVTKPRM